MQTGATGPDSGVSRDFLRECVRRISSLALLIAAILSAIQIDFWIGTGVFFCSIALYVFVPRPQVPQAAERLDRMPAIVGPDILGFLLTTCFFTLPFIARFSDPEYWQDMGLLVHPSSLLVWPLAMISASLFWIGASNACFWLIIKDDGLIIHQRTGRVEFSYQDIKAVGPYRRGLPRWLKLLAPLLAMQGSYTASGALLLARDETGIQLELTGGEQIRVPLAAFEEPMKRLQKALRTNGVPKEGQG